MFSEFINVLLFLIAWIYKIVHKNITKVLIHEHIKPPKMGDDSKVHNIFALSDYSLIHIFKYVSSTDLYNLSLTCKRFEGLVKEKKLWHKIDARDGLNSKEKVKYCINRINERTTDFLICSDRRDVQVLPDDFFTSNACSNLTVLALENQLIRGDLAKLSEYPKSLVELSLKKSFVHSHSTFFKLSYWQMENLKVLILDECAWVETYMLVQMSKYAKLEVLSLYKCKKLSDNDIAYLSLAGCFGFKQLRILDIRFTGLGDQILKTFYKHPTLQELYFQSYISTYRLDKTRRLLEIARGSSRKPYAYLSEYDDITDTSMKSMEQLFGNHLYRPCKRQNLSNHGIVMYKFVVPNLDDEYEVKSVLYKPPYGECTCGYGDRHVQSFSTFKGKSKDVQCNREEIIKLKNVIKEEKYKKCLPYTYVLTPKLHMDPFKNKTNIAFYEEQASTSNKQVDWINVREPVNLYEMAMFEHTDIHSLQSDVVLPLEVMKCFGCDPTVILGEPGPKLGDSNAEDALQDSSSEDSDVELKSGRNNSEMSQKFIALEENDVIVEEFYESCEDSDGQTARLKAREPLSEDCGVKSEDRNESQNCKVKDSSQTNGESSKSKVNLSDNDSKPDSERDDLKKCKNCGITMNRTADKFENGHDTCEKCGETSKSQPKNSESKIVRFKFKRNRSGEENDDNAYGEVIIEPLSSSPSGTGNNLNKRRCDNDNSSADAKKFKSSDDFDDSNLDRHEQLDLNISYEVEAANVRLRSPHMVYINVDQVGNGGPDLIDVPIGGGLINILLGVDNKTKAAIKKLSLRGYPKITDAALDYLTALKLDLLDITKTGITRTAVMNFIRQNPTCRVLHESACVCLPDMHF